MQRRVKKRFNRGFTLIECLMAVLLVGIAVAALVAANGSLTRINAAGAELSTAEFLIEQIRELAALVDYDDIDDLNNITFNPPITSDQQPLTDFSAYTQQVTVDYIQQADFSAVDPTETSDFVRITVKVLLNSKEISSASWIRANY